MLERLTAVHILTEGTWNGTTFTAEDLVAIAADFQATVRAFPRPVKITHATDAEGTVNTLAWGSVEQVRTRMRDGKTELVADLQVLPFILEAHQQGRLLSRSVELFETFTIDGTTYQNFLAAVAFLGTELPAVADLEPIQLPEPAEPAAAAFAVKKPATKTLTFSLAATQPPRPSHDFAAKGELTRLQQENAALKRQLSKTHTDRFLGELQDRGLPVNRLVELGLDVLLEHLDSERRLLTFSRNGQEHRVAPGSILRTILTDSALTQTIHFGERSSGTSKPNVPSETDHPFFGALRASADDFQKFAGKTGISAAELIGSRQATTTIQ